MRQSPGSMRRGTTAGGTTALTDVSSIPPVSSPRHRTNVQMSGSGHHDLAGLADGPVSGCQVDARRPTGCRGRRPRPRPSPNASSTRVRMTTPATIVGARSGCSPRDLAALGDRQRGEPLEQRLERRAREHVALDLRGVVGLEREVDRGARRRGAGDRDGGLRPARGRPPGTAPATPASTSAASAASSARVGGSECRVALGVAHDADLRGDVEAELAARAADELGRAAADVDHDELGRIVRRPRRGRAREGERRLLVACRACAPPARSARAPSRRTRRRWRRRAPRRSSPRRSPRTRARRSPRRSARARRTRAPAARRRAGRSRRRPRRGA